MKRLPNDPSPNSPMRFEPNRLVVEPLIRAALLEDIARGNDITTDAIVPANRRASANLNARTPGTVAGLNASLLAFQLLDPTVEIITHVADGEQVDAGA